MKTNSQSNQSQHQPANSAQQPQSAVDRAESSDQVSTPPNDPVIYLPPTQAELEEAARAGQAQDSALLGAEVPPEASMAADEPPTAGDPDAMDYQSKVVGEEAIGGTTPTPDQSNVDDIAAAVGISTKPENPVGVKAELDRRDAHRFELDPESKDPTSSM
jgi:formylglycine-generating enzyme required for sulfatase activity